MATTRYLAMTAWEFASARPLPQKAAWMACHFSPEDAGLCDLPESLPPGSLLILNDRIPMNGQSSLQITAQLQQVVEEQECSGVLLDFQRPDNSGQNALAAQLAASLPCPVAVSPLYAKGLDCPVFLSPCPHHVHLQEHIQPWKGRELWLDLAVDAEAITLTEQGASIASLSLSEFPEVDHQEEGLYCHYRIETGNDFVRFTLWRTIADLGALEQKAASLGIETLVGLYQELG